MDPPAGNTMGIRDLLARLDSLAEENYFDAPAADATGPAPLGALADPRCHRDPLDIDGRGANGLRALLGGMIAIREAEIALGRLVESGDVVCPVHLAVGQEAIPVGVSHNLDAADRVFGGHRSHGHYLAQGGDLDQLFAEVLGKDTGCSRGMGGSMHLFAPEVGFWGSVPIVGATIPVAVGAALAAKMDGKGAVAVAYFGDGAAEEGVLHEALNMASTMKLPVLFVCENNLYASHMDIAQRQPHDSTARFAHAHSVPARVVDGNDALAVARAAGQLIGESRAGRGPGYLEAVSYRWYGHVGPDENIDVGLRRSAEELAAWKQRDPVMRLGAAMTARGDLTDADIESIRADAAARAAQAAERALAAPYPEAQALFDRVFARRAG
jgi:pyruvate dehydrogenase E1 component alpha subunit